MVVPTIFKWPRVYSFNVWDFGEQYHGQKHMLLVQNWKIYYQRYISLFLCNHFNSSLFSTYYLNLLPLLSRHFKFAFYTKTLKPGSACFLLRSFIDS